jgi:hypothetical protein
MVVVEMVMVMTIMLLLVLRWCCTYARASERCRCSHSFNLASFTYLHLHPGTSGRAEVRFLFDDFQQCAVYNGALSGPDSVYASVPHLGIVAESWRGNVTVAGL